MKASFRALFVPVALPFLAVLVPHAARAQGAPVGERAAPLLRWAAPADCPTEAAVNEELTTLTGHPENAEGAKAAAATVTPSRSRSPGEGLDVELRFPGRPPRRFRAATCREAASATALIVALTFHPEAPALAALPATPTPPSTPEPPPAPPVPPEKPPVPPPEKPAQEAPRETPREAAKAASAPRVQLAAFAGATLDAGTLPGPTPGVAVGLALGAPHHLRVAASVATFLDRERATPNGAVASFSLLSVQLRGCWELPFAGRFTAGPCLGGRFAHVSPNLFGDGVRTGGNRGRQPDGAALFGLGGGGQVALRLSPIFAVRGELAVDGWLTHPQFLVVDPVTGAGTAVHGVPKASFFGALSVEGRFL